MRTCSLEFGYRLVRMMRTQATLPYWLLDAPVRPPQFETRPTIQGQFVFAGRAGREKVRATMSLQNGKVMVFPSGRRSDTGIDAATWRGNPSGDGEFQVWGFGCIPVEVGRFAGCNAARLDAVAAELRRLGVSVLAKAN